jgi:hypothetical protein
MVYILKGKVSGFKLRRRLMAIIWTASSDAARQACGEAATAGEMLRLLRAIDFLVSERPRHESDSRHSP